MKIKDIEEGKWYTGDSISGSSTRLIPGKWYIKVIYKPKNDNKKWKWVVYRGLKGKYTEYSAYNMLYDGKLSIVGPKMQKVLDLGLIQ